MTARLLGAACVLVGAAGAGFLRAAHWAGEAALLASFCQALARMAGEIRCNQTRLPPLCRQLARELTGPADFFRSRPGVGSGGASGRGAVGRGAAAPRLPGGGAADLA